MTQENKEDGSQPSPAVTGSAPAAKRRFEVLVTAYKTVIVEAEDEEEAMEIAGGECTSSEWEIDEWKVDRELETDYEVERALAHGACLVENWWG